MCRQTAQFTQQPKSNRDRSSARQFPARPSRGFPPTRAATGGSARPALIRCCFVNTSLEFPGIRRISQQRVHVHDASLPSTGSSRALVPPLLRYYRGTTTSCRPSRRASLPSLGGTTGALPLSLARRGGVHPRRAWSWSPGISGREFFRGDDRISQVPGEPRFPFAHVLRPRPAETPLTIARRPHGPRAGNDEGADENIDFRGSIAWLSG